MPTEKTRRDYEKLAKHFYKKRLGTEPPSPKRICDALTECAEQYRPAYWRRLRNALEFDQREKGYNQAADRISSTRNPMTTIATGQGIIDPTLRGPTAAKKKRAKSINSDDRAKLWAAAKELKDHNETCAAILLAERLGVRPVEMLELNVDPECGVVNIVGAKKSDGLRGADRTLTLPDDPRIRKNIAAAARIIQSAERDKEGAVHRIQSRLDRLSRKLWPRRQARPSLYTFRHQMGGNLKALGLKRTAIAYIMGHQSTKSVEVYGDRRSGSSSGIGIKLDGQEEQAFQGRENHREPHAPHEQRAEPATTLAEQKESPIEPTEPSFRRPSGPAL